MQQIIAQFIYRFFSSNFYQNSNGITMIGALMLDIAGTELTQEDIELLQAPQVGGMILFAEILNPLNRSVH